MKTLYASVPTGNTSFVLSMVILFALFVALAPAVYAKTEADPILKDTAAADEPVTRADKAKQEHKLWEVRGAPLALLAQWYSFDLSYRLNPKWSTGPSGIRYAASSNGNMLLPSMNGYAVGWNLNYYVNGVDQSSWYFGGYLFYEDYNRYPHSSSPPQKITGSRADYIMGYRIYHAPFALLLGAGFQFSSQRQRRIYADSAGPNLDKGDTLLQISFPRLEVKLGIEF